jgi:hypothetical protein
MDENKEKAQILSGIGSMSGMTCRQMIRALQMAGSQLRSL